MVSYGYGATRDSVTPARHVEERLLASHLHCSDSCATPVLSAGLFLQSFCALSCVTLAKMSAKRRIIALFDVDGTLTPARKVGIPITRCPLHALG